MEIALDGWRLPRTPTRVVLRSAVHLLVGHCDAGCEEDADESAVQDVNV